MSGCSPGAVPLLGANLEPTPGARSVCLRCGEIVTARCGERTAAHWAHRPRYAWGAVSAQDSAWVVAWQAHAHPTFRDVEVSDGVAHLLGPDGTAVMLVGAGGVSPAAIRATEAALDDVTWLVDCRSAAEEFRLSVRAPRPGSTYRTFRWKHPMRVLTECRAPVYLDLGEQWTRELDGHPGRLSAHPGGDLLKIGRQRSGALAVYLPTPGAENRRTGGWGHVLAADLIRSQMAAWRPTP